VSSSIDPSLRDGENTEIKKTLDSKTTKFSMALEDNNEN
jgi:hypothetical protein